MILKDRFERLKAVDRMVLAARYAFAYYLGYSEKDPSLLTQAQLRIRDIRDSAAELDDTFLIRVFAEFEMTLRDYWHNALRHATEPAVSILIDRIASKRYVRYDDLKSVHQIREYRNSVVHDRRMVNRVTLPEARSSLCKFLAYLPASW